MEGQTNTTRTEGATLGVLGSVPAAIAVVDGLGRYSYWNARMEALTGRPAALVLGQPAWRGFADEPVDTAIDEVLRSSGPAPAVTVDVVVDGAARPLRLEAAPLPEGSFKNAVVVVATAADPPPSPAAAPAAGDGGRQARRDEFLYAELERAVMNMLKLSQGDCSVDASQTPGDEHTEDLAGMFAVVNEALGQTAGAIRQVLDRIARLSDAAVEGSFHVRASDEGLAGEFQAVVAGVNVIVDTLVGFLDAVPLPVVVSDRELKVRFMNASALRFVGAEQGQALGRPCADLVRAEHCRTALCGCHTAMAAGERVDRETSVLASGARRDVSYSALPVRGRGGEVIGAFEVLTDQTDLKQALRRGETRAAYQAAEMEKMVVALSRVAEGDFAIDNAVAPSDDQTRDIAEAFTVLNEALGLTIAAVRRLVTDAARLAKSAAKGQLDARVDVESYQGEFRDVVSGVNEILDAIVRPVMETSEALATLAEYDLRVRIESDYQGDYARLKNSLNATADTLSDALQQVASVVLQVESASDQIASGSELVAQSASEQAAALETTSANLEQMAGMTRQNAENTKVAKTIAEDAHQAAEKGTAAMTEMMASMRRIKTAASDTAAIIRDINEIAFQTNLLALNAAVEAARAGDAGRGFAVVAEEVRNLAGRSKDAARKTEVLIKESMNLSETGESRAKEVDAALTRIFASAEKVKAIVGEIATASQEQTQGIETVNRTVAEMDQAVQGAAASAEESASSAAELADQARVLHSLVERFKLGDEEDEEVPQPRFDRRVAPRAPAPPPGIARPRPHDRTSRLGRN